MRNCCCTNHGAVGSSTGELVFSYAKVSAGLAHTVRSSPGLGADRPRHPLILDTGRTYAISHNEWKPSYRKVHREPIDRSSHRTSMCHKPHADLARHLLTHKVNRNWSGGCG